MVHVSRGFCYPFGASLRKEGVNFSIYAKTVESMSLCLYEEGLTTPFAKIELDPKIHKSGLVWHVCVEGLPESFVYAYEVTFPQQKETQLLLDPFAKAVFSDAKWHAKSRKKFNYKPLGKFYIDNFDWEDDVPPNIPKRDLVIYEMHVRGFTQHLSSLAKAPGTFQGIIEKIPYLLDLGINAVELLPIQEFCEEDVIHVNPKNGKKLHNYFGYSTTNFFSPMNRYASQTAGCKAVNELKMLVKELHRNGIEVILDVVFNHTSEGNEKGPIQSFKGLDCEAYYLLNANNQFYNFSGCGNTFHCNHPITREFIRDALRHWVLEYHIDGFRFDLAAVFNRGKDGMELDYSPMLELLSFDPILSSRKLIAEPWDAGGLYHLGKFARLGKRWSEWNGKYQSRVRNFIKGSSHFKSQFAAALCGSKDIFPNSAYSSVNYIACHDGFSLADVVSYNQKNNVENGEHNADGSNDNDSWDCGFDGECSNKTIMALRKRQMRNFHLALMLSQGIPMLLMGDEYGHSKRGNNNTWGQDNELNWFIWHKLHEEKEFHRFYKKLIHFRRHCPLLKYDEFLTEKEIQWHGLIPQQPDWNNDNKFLAFTIHHPEGQPGIYAAFNALHQAQEVEIPFADLHWEWVVNTNNCMPKDFYEKREVLKESKIKMGPYSSIMLIAHT